MHRAALGGNAQAINVRMHGGIWGRGFFSQGEQGIPSMHRAALEGNTQAINLHVRMGEGCGEGVRRKGDSPSTLVGY